MERCYVTRVNFEKQVAIVLHPAGSQHPLGFFFVFHIPLCRYINIVSRERLKGAYANTKDQSQSIKTN